MAQLPRLRLYESYSVDIMGVLLKLPLDPDTLIGDVVISP